MKINQKNEDNEEAEEEEDEPKPSSKTILKTL